MNHTINKMRENSKYWLEYDYLINSSGSELFYIDEIPCILNCTELYCMVMDYSSDMLKSLEIYLNKVIGRKNILINFNTKYDEDMKYLASYQYNFHSSYNTFVANNEININHSIIANKNIIELTCSNIDFYKWEYCNVKIQYRPSFERLVDVFVRQNNGRIIAFVENNCILGYLSYTNIFGNVNDVDYIYISEKYRKKGIGTLLAKYYSIQSANENKFALWSNAENIVSEKTALDADFRWCCKHMSFYKNVGN